MTRPIRPSEVTKRLPECLIEAVNELIQENVKAGPFSIKMKDIKARTISKMNHGDFLNIWLDFEAEYEKAGWSVKFVMSDYTEHFDSYYIFEEMPALPQKNWGPPPGGLTE